MARTTAAPSNAVSGHGPRELGPFLGPADFLLGHNFISFDAKHLEANKPTLGLLEKPVIDTLWLNPLAFPRNPYHHLVKHYQDGDCKLVTSTIRSSTPSLF
jgi:DNA polymerase III alpha subunit (gram-positive type)